MTIEEALGYTFSNKSLLERALTRKAYALEQKQQNIECEDQEIFQTLGDAVLKLILVEHLIETGSDTRENITNEKMNLESRVRLAEISRQLGIGTFIKLGIGEIRQKAHEKQSVLAETLEALIAAIYLDGGYNVSKETIIKWFGI
jgi:ribonuclease-3